MKTAVIMKRDLFGGEVGQNSKTGFISATDIVHAGNVWRVSNGLGIFHFSTWIKSQNVKDFIFELEKQEGKVYIPGIGRGNHSWMHPYLALDLALALNPKFKVEVYKWLYDNLLSFRNSSGDSYKMMTGAIYEICDNKSKFKGIICSIAKKIQNECGVNDWETATEDQLRLRDQIHKMIFSLSDFIRDYRSLVTISIDKAKQLS